ncbi:RNA polymerase sigma-70 factor [Cyclobacterium sp. SYSU L10401]|uniref:RNA polymerase sigma-70 factor n=1 Tax=Cyclobacterium sp. SYSU L10401 TaxID=2678657 RepID=UPI0013D4DA07|nr:RNA polymerase sigma-70 factor [Cyclobacterium sp. SYSU L10401]
MTDQELCQKLYEGDKKAFDGIYRKYWERLFLYVYKISGDRYQSEDIVQEVFVKLWRRRQVRKINQLENYLFKSAKYGVSNLIRDRRIRLPLEDYMANLVEEVNADLLIEEKETERIIRESIGSLPSRCQEVFIMSRDDFQSNKEIAQQLNLSVRTVETQIHKALKFIKKNLGQIYFW